MIGFYLVLFNAAQGKPLEELINVLQSGATHDYIGEPVSQLEHALQCAQAAIDAGADDETIIAALFHDIGHLCTADDIASMGSYGIKEHEKVGAQLMRDYGFSEKIAQLIEGHVQAKWYLTFKYRDYYEKLSEASKQTLMYQGGPMSAIEAIAFELDPLFEQKLQMRVWDEQAKKIGWQGASLDSYKKLLRNYAQLSSPYSIQIAHAAHIASLIDSIAVMRLEQYKAYPYLYYGTMTCERAYLQSYIHEQGIVV